MKTARREGGGRLQLHFAEHALAHDVVGEGGDQVDADEDVAEQAPRIQCRRFSGLANSDLAILFSGSSSVSCSVKASALRDSLVGADRKQARRARPAPSREDHRICPC